MHFRSAIHTLLDNSRGVDFLYAYSEGNCSFSVLSLSSLMEDRIKFALFDTMDGAQESPRYRAA